MWTSLPDKREWGDRYAATKAMGNCARRSIRYPYAQPGVQSWVLTSLAEMAARAGMAQEAEAHFRAALAVDAADNYLLGAYADFLLDHDRPKEVARSYCGTRPARTPCCCATPWH